MDKICGATAWSLVALGWSLTVLTPVFLLYLVMSGHWLSLSLYSLFWYLVNSDRLKLRKSETLVKLLQRFLALWLPDGILITGAPAGTSDSPTLFCVHPHGVLSGGFVLCALELAQRQPDLVVVGNPYVYHLCPALRLLFGLIGLELCSSSKTDFQRVMGERKPMLFMPGGFQEAALASTTQEAVYLKSRRGFIKYALRFGYKIQPVYVFGENKLYNTFNFLEHSRVFISGFNIPAVLFWGQPYAPWLPRRDAAKQLHVVFGREVAGPAAGPAQERRPTTAEVDQCKTEYVARLTSVYDKFRRPDDPDTLRLV